TTRPYYPWFTFIHYPHDYVSFFWVSLMNWVFSIYLLTNAMMTPIYGKLTDLVGRKPVMQAGLIIFIVGSMMSGLSNSMPVLIFWRAI
ncbi:MFS transporter, partial [Lactiplantibacillus plantarum]